MNHLKFKVTLTGNSTKKRNMMYQANCARDCFLPGSTDEKDRWGLVASHIIRRGALHLLLKTHATLQPYTLNLTPKPFGKL